MASASLLPDKPNPKYVQAQKDGKAPLEFLEPAANEAIARVMATGAEKYGPRNFIIDAITATTYIGAIRRHLDAWMEGQDVDPDSGFTHLAHIGANIHVVLAAMAHDKCIDDRFPASDDRKPICDCLQFKKLGLCYHTAASEVVHRVEGYRR